MKNKSHEEQPGEVTSLETRWIVQCQNDNDGEWYDFGVYECLSVARVKIIECRKYRPATYRIIRRKILDVMLPS